MKIKNILIITCLLIHSFGSFSALQAKDVFPVSVQESLCAEKLSNSLVTACGVSYLVNIVELSINILTQADLVRKHPHETHEEKSADSKQTSREKLLSAIVVRSVSKRTGSIKNQVDTDSANTSNSIIHHTSNPNTIIVQLTNECAVIHNILFPMLLASLPRSAIDSSVTTYNAVVNIKQIQSPF